MDTIKKNNLGHVIKEQSKEKNIDVRNYKIFKIGLKSYSLPYEKIEDFSSYCMKVLRGNSWGLVGFDGNEILPCQFGYIGNLKNGFAKTGIDEIFEQLNNSFPIGLISERGEIIIPQVYTKYNKIDDEYFLVSKSFHKFRTEGLYYSLEKKGIYNIKEKREIIPCIYDELKKSENGLFEVKIKVQTNQNNYSTFKGLLNTEGKSLFESDNSTFLACELIEKREDGYFSFFKQELMGVIDSRGNVIIDAKYNFIDKFKEGKAIFINHAEQDVYPEYGSWYTIHEYSYGFVNESGEEFIKGIFDEVNEFYWGLARVKSKEKYGFVDMSGNIVIPIQFEQASNFNNGVSIVQKTEQIYVPQEEYKYILSSIKGSIISKSSYMLINKKGENITNFLFEDISDSKVGIFKVQLNRKYGYIDNKGKIIISIIYDYISDFVDGLSICTLIDAEGSWKKGFIDINNKIRIPIIYDEVESFKDGVATVKKIYRENNVRKYEESKINIKGKTLETKEYFEEVIVK